jgi:hypothetical protein
MGIVKSPMGMMVGFMAIALFLLPKLMDNIGKQHEYAKQET